MRKVLAKLREAGLFIKPEKRKFNVTRTTFLGFIISMDGIGMDPAKVNVVLDWDPPRNVKEVQCFLGFANFYR